MGLDFSRRICYDTTNKEVTAVTKGKLMNLSAMAIFGTIGIFVRHIPLPSSLIALVRAAVGLAFLILMLAAKRQRPDFSAIRKNLPLLILSGIFLGANWIALFEAYRYTAVSTATVCYYTAPLLVLALSPILLKEKLTGFQAGCMAAALVGMVLVTAPWQADASLPGIAWGMSAACLYAGVILTNRRLKGLTPFDTTLVQLLSSALVLTPYVQMTEELTALSPTPTVLFLLLVVGIVHTGLAYTLYFGSIPMLPARTVAIYGYLDPVLAVVLSALLLREPLTATGIIGIILVLGAAFLSERRS